MIYCNGRVRQHTGSSTTVVFKPGASQKHYLGEALPKAPPSQLQVLSSNLLVHMRPCCPLPGRHSSQPAWLHGSSALTETSSLPWNNMAATDTASKHHKTSATKEQMCSIYLALNNFNLNSCVWLVTVVGDRSCTGLLTGMGPRVVMPSAA